MIRRVTWRSWAALAAGLAAYGALGWLWSGDGAVEMWLYRIGLTAAAVMPVLFAVIYTAIGQKWWRWDIGTVLTLAALSIVPTAAPLAYTFWFNGGVLTSSWLAWLEVSGPMLSALILGWACWVWLRLYRAGRLLGDGNGAQEGGSDDAHPG